MLWDFHALSWYSKFLEWNTQTNTNNENVSLIKNHALKVESSGFEDYLWKLKAKSMTLFLPASLSSPFSKM